MAKGSRWPSDAKGSGKGKGKPPDNYKTDLCKFFERGLCEKGKACSFAHGKEELRPSSVPDNVTANKQKDAEVMSWLKERREEEGEEFEQQWKAWCKIHGLKDLPKTERLKCIHDFREQVESGQQASSKGAGKVSDGADVAVCPQKHRLKECLASDEYECDGCGADIHQGSTLRDCRECDYSLCLECVNRPRPAIDERQSPPIPQHVAAAPASVTYEAAKLETDAAHPATNEWSDDVNSAAAAVWASSTDAIRSKLKHAIEDGLKLGDLIGLAAQQSPLNCPELVRQCEGRCASFIGHFLFPGALPTVVQTCLSEQNLAGVCRALRLEDLLQLELDAEVTTRASIASSFFMALFRAARRSPDNACLLVAVEAMLDFVCLIGTSHFVAMGVMSADATLQDPRSDLESGGEEVIWHCEDATGSGKQPDAAADPNLAEETEEDARARRVQAQQDRKSSLRWDYTGGYRPAEAKRPESNEEATLRLINARCKGLHLGSEKASAARAEEEGPSNQMREPRGGAALSSDDPKPARFKKDLCKYFERGHCDKGAQCTFAHGYEELRDGGNKAASSNGFSVHHGPSWEAGPPRAAPVYRKKI